MPHPPGRAGWQRSRSATVPRLRHTDIGDGLYPASSAIARAEALLISTDTL
jgi:hypothetical protein